MNLIQDFIKTPEFGEYTKYINRKQWLSNWTAYLERYRKFFPFFDKKSKVSIITLAATVEDDKEEFSFIYAYLISVDKELKYYMAASSFESYDGEYVPYIMPIQILKDINSKEYIDELVTDMIKDEQIILDVYTFNAGDKIKEQILNNRLEVKLLCMSIENFLAFKKIGYIPININKRYKKFIDILLEDVTFPSDTKFKNYHEFISKNQNNDTKIQTQFYVGLKMIPLYNIEAQSVSFLLRVWQEKLSLIILSEQMMNMRCRGFPAYYGDCYIHNVMDHLFQNESFMLKARRSEKIREVRERFDADVPDDPAMLNAPLQHLRNLITYADECIGLSGTAEVLIQEHMDITMADQVFKMRDGRLDDRDMIAHSFNIVHNIYVMGMNRIFHTDLHLRNIVVTYCGRHTLSNWGGLVLYKVGDTNYVLPELGATGGIIDFSQAIVLNTIDDDNDIFPFRQNILESYYDYIYIVIAKHMKFTPKEEKLVRAAIKDQPELIYPAMITLDLLMFTESMLGWHVWDDEPDFKAKFANSLILFKKLQDLARSTLDSRFELFFAQGSAEELQQLPNPMPLIIKECFLDYFGKGQIPDVTTNIRYKPDLMKDHLNNINFVYSYQHSMFIKLESLNYDYLVNNPRPPRPVGAKPPKDEDE